MKMILKKILVVGFVLFISCKKNNDEKRPVETIKIPSYTSLKNRTPLNSSSVVDSSFVVRLETTKESLLGSIDKLMVYNEHIYILNKRQSKGVFQFDIKGNFIRKFGKVGKGPGEYKSPNSFTINKKDKQLIISDQSGRYLLVYNLNGKYLRRLKNNKLFYDFVYDNSGKKYVLDVHNMRKESSGDGTGFYSILIKNKKGKVISKQLKKHSKVSGYMSSKNLSVSGEDVLFNEPYTNIIYRIDEKEATPRFKMAFEDKEIPEKKYKDFTVFKEEIAANNYSYLFNVAGYSIINNVLLFTVKQYKYPIRYLYSLDTRKLYSINGFKDYATLGFGFNGQHVGSYKKYAINYLQPDWIKGTEGNYTSEKMKQFIKDTKPTDNPILIFNKLRDDL